MEPVPEGSDVPSKAQVRYGNTNVTVISSEMVLSKNLLTGWCHQFREML
jgi:hypothetical protein